MGEILFLAHRIPFPPDRGDKIRSHHLLNALAGLAPVHVACLADDDDDAAQEPELARLAASYCLQPRTKSLVRAGAEAMARGRPVSLTAFAGQNLRRYVARVLAERPIRAIFVFSGQMGQYVPPGWKGPVVIDFVDVDSAKFGAYAAASRWPMRWIHAREDRLLRAEEARLAARASTSLLVSAPEAALFQSRLPANLQERCRILALGNGIDHIAYDPAAMVPEPRLQLAPGPRLIFTGQMDYPPYVAAAVRAATRIMPLVRAVHPQASFHVIGRKPVRAVLALDGVHGCRVWGRVADVRPWLAAADLALVPLDIARGVQNKVLEAMAMGLPVVASSAAATGIAAEPGHSIAVADSDAAIAAAVIALAKDPAGAEAMGGRGRAAVVAGHSWPAVLAPLGPLLGFGPPPEARHAA